MQLDDITVSRSHAQIVPGEGVYEIRDLGSTNGTYVNGSRVERSELRHGDELRVGRFRLIFLLSQF